MKVTPFQTELTSQVVELIVDIQRDEYAIDITAAQQPDLLDIPGFYQVGSGNFWVALQDECVVGTIALLDIGNHQAALRKMFVQPAFRGQQVGAAQSLLDTLFEWASRHEVRDIFLGTTPKFLAAHRFYEKQGFAEVDRATLPTAFPIMAVDKKFYHRRVGSEAAKA